MKEPDCLDAVRQAKQVDRSHDSRLDKSPSVWTLVRDVVAMVGSTKVASSVSGLSVMWKVTSTYVTNQIILISGTPGGCGVG